MSLSEVGRLEVIQKTDSNLINRKQAATLLGLSTRQVIRLLKRYRAEGATGLVSKHRGKQGNRGHTQAFKKEVMRHVKATYADFGPTLAAEKLREIQGLALNKETLRQWMMEAGYWKGKSRKSVVPHQQRTRRPCLGELIQIDGSPHDWFEGRRSSCCLLAFIDDATGRIMQLRFEESETTWGYLSALRNYIEIWGRPVAFYSDRHGIFRVNIPEAKDSTGETQFGRVIRELGIQLICANSAQAKGRVERLNKTLQDRLVKELRLRGINSVEAANAFLPKFIIDFNKRFAVKPSSPTDAHRKSLPDRSSLDLIFTLQEVRTLSKNLELSYNNVIYQIQHAGKGYRLRQAKVTVCENRAKEIFLLYKGQLLSYTTFDKANRPTPTVNSKEINVAIDHRLEEDSLIKKYKPAHNHPWRRSYQPEVSASP